ncbi:MAG: sulfatase-like hydrolase/transferase [Planctomycetota bacterium]|jgi:arylsulfatase A-like enzyme|nr:sulfatase-like hydrolase/transferase [Planctomycetota bacterium]
MTTRPERYRWSLAWLLLLFAACGRQPRPGVPPTHLVLVTIEHLRADHCTVLGYPRETTALLRPDGLRTMGLDHLAETGVLFSQAFAPSGSTRTSLASLFSSEPPPSTGVFDDEGVLGHEFPVLAEALGAGGFATGAFCLPSKPLSGSGLERGFTTFEEGEDQVLVLGAAHEWVSAQIEAEEPFFLWIHLGWITPALGEMPITSEPIDDPYVSPDPWDITDRYDSALHATVAYMRAFLEAVGLIDEELIPDSLIVLAGLQGMELKERGEFVGAEGSVHEESLHVPLILRHPASLTGSRILDEQVELADVAPTLLDWFELDPRTIGTGRSLLALCDSYVERPFESRPSFALGGDHGSVRTPRWRLVIRLEAAGEADGDQRLPDVALYDAPSDPGLLIDVAARHPEVVETLRASLKAWLAAAGAAR